MRSRDAVTISLPPAMSRALEKARKTQQRSRSEIVCEALRLYFEPELALRIARLPVYKPTARELRALERGRRSKSYLTIDELFRDLDGPRRSSRSKGSRSRA